MSEPAPPSGAERDPDVQLTADDPMTAQIEAALSTPQQTGDTPDQRAWSLPDTGRGALEPGEPASMQHEPDASQ